MDVDPQPAPDSAADRDLRYVMAHANCLLWHAEVTETPEPGRYDWQIHVFDEEAAQRFLPLELLSGENYMQALQRSKLPEDMPVMDRVSGTALETRASHYRQDFRCRRADGEIRWLHEEVRIEPLEPGPSGRRWRTAGVFTEITGRKRVEEALRASEARYRALVENFPNGSVFLLDRDLRFLVAGGTALGQAGHFPGDLEGKTIFEALPPESSGSAAPLYRAVVEGQEIGIEAEWDGRVYAVRGLPLRDEQGTILAGMVMTQDVTERRRLAEALERRAEALAEAGNQLQEEARRKDEFLAMLAHELRNPLAPILNAVQLLQGRGGKDPAVQRARDVVERQTRHLARLVDDLLDVARITRGQIELRKSAIELQPLVAGAVQTARPLIDARGLRLSLSVPREPIWLDGDPTRLEQVLVNLLNNAAKFTEPPGRLWLAAACEGQEVVVRVRDSGIGIAPEMLAAVFDLFTQADRSLDRAQGGLGIGLTLVRTLIEMHGGRVEAHSEGPGRGSEFVLRLPALSPPPAAESAEAGDEILDARYRILDTGYAMEDARRARPSSHIQHPASSIQYPASTTKRPPSRILVVEDNADTAEMLTSLLEMLGHEVRTARDGPEALALAPVFRPQVVLLDIGLPGLDGYEVARRLRAQPGGRDLLLIALTGYGSAQDRERARQAGCDHHVTKPVDVKALQDLLARTPAGAAQG